MYSSCVSYLYLCICVVYFILCQGVCPSPLAYRNNNQQSITAGEQISLNIYPRLHQPGKYPINIDLIVCINRMYGNYRRQNILTIGPRLSSCRAFSAPPKIRIATIVGGGRFVLPAFKERTEKCKTKGPTGQS